MRCKNTNGTCAQCGASFYACDAKGRPKNFCSVLCRNQHNAALKAPREFVDRICEWCGEAFSALGSEVRRGHGQFCSNTCQTKWSGKNRSRKVEQVCGTCGKVMFRSPSLARKRPFCSVACKARGMQGEANWGWSVSNRVPKNEYVFVRAPNHPRSYCGWIYEHILIAEEMLGRPLRQDEEVHHVDENKRNNSPSNLIVMTKSEHSSLHARQRWAEQRKRQKTLTRMTKLSA